MRYVSGHGHLCMTCAGRLQAEAEELERRFVELQQKKANDNSSDCSAGTQSGH